MRHGGDVILRRHRAWHSGNREGGKERRVLLLDARDIKIGKNLRQDGLLLRNPRISVERAFVQIELQALRERRDIKCIIEAIGIRRNLHPSSAAIGIGNSAPCSHLCSHWRQNVLRKLITVSAFLFPCIASSQGNKPDVGDVMLSNTKHMYTQCEQNFIDQNEKSWCYDALSAYAMSAAGFNYLQNGGSTATTQKFNLAMNAIKKQCEETLAGGNGKLVLVPACEIEGAIKFMQKYSTTPQAQTSATREMPKDCLSPSAHAYELQYIPYVLNLPAYAAKIVSIETIGNMPTFPDGYGHPQIFCNITVKWGNGKTDYGYLFHMWQGKYGQIMVEYGPH